MTDAVFYWACVVVGAVAAVMIVLCVLLEQRK